ncbi:MAG: hypothetical protein A3C35_04150 [Omnitrophica bacterium RIFCSPHIGHO2_02_FULL_46_11]|nr:MAG: hypothetical protein A3A81_06105 [Omnitrophica bacterium RIFCSPLOWO2_01_FULL_45_10b]OGW86900.1 MAG: hypothetical protein A3C35_04150 [Omnitrophica bacterium RIFCSPHIGHO2_02_FULL_46_11]
MRPFKKLIQRLKDKNKSIARVFNDIYHSRRWTGSDSISGTGSGLAQTVALRRELSALLKRLNIKSLLDAPCGDFHWMKEVDLGTRCYTGIDIVSDLIVENQKKYNNEYRKFISFDISRDPLPQVDMILCRDCFVHLSFKNIIATIKNFKRSGSKHLLTTTFHKWTKNADIVTGGWRPINLQLRPFSFPDPIQIIDEQCSGAERQYWDKSLGLWKLEDIQI